METEGRSRLDVDSSQYVAQVGYDFNRSEMQNGVPQSLSGVYFAYSRADSRFYDQSSTTNIVLKTALWLLINIPVKVKQQQQISVYITYTVHQIMPMWTQ